VDVATVAIFPSVLGVRPGTHDAADEFRNAGHEVHIIDIFEGRTFDDYPPAMAFAWEELGQAEMLRRALAGVSDLSDGFVPTGFSLGCMLAAYVATQRPVSGVVMIAGAIPVSLMGEQWPVGVPAQTHSMLGDPWREQAEIDQTLRDIEAARSHIDVFDYPGSGHLFSDPTLPEEYDAEATRIMWGRVLPFVASLT
jgi:dienelactone hydrolase